jgi:hypothetical protein
MRPAVRVALSARARNTNTGALTDTATRDFIMQRLAALAKLHRAERHKD